MTAPLLPPDGGAPPSLPPDEAAPPPSRGDDGVPPHGPEPAHGATWGPLEVAIGISATLLLVVLGPGLLGLALLQYGADGESVAFRYGLGLLLEATLLVVPFGVARRSRGGAPALGLVRARGRALAEGAGIGLVLYLLVLATEVVLTRVAPEIAAEMMKEQEQQLEALAGPWPLLALMALVVAPVCEEVFFRGFVFGGLRRRVDFGWASGLSAVLFAAVHAMPWSMIPLFFVGLGCALAYERHRSLLASITTHVSFNGISLVIYFTLQRT